MTKPIFPVEALLQPESVPQAQTKRIGNRVRIRSGIDSLRF